MLLTINFCRAAGNDEAASDLIRPEAGVKIGVETAWGLGDNSGMNLIGNRQDLFAVRRALWEGKAW